MEKVNVEIQFSRVVTYNVRTKISKENFEKIKDLDGDDLNMYQRENDAYDIINEFAEDFNEYDWSEELTNVTVTEIDN